MEGDLAEKKGHGEDQPDINHFFDVGRRWEGLRDSSKTEEEKKEMLKVSKISRSLTRLPMLEER